MSETIWSELSGLASDDPHIRVLSDEEASELVDAVASKFVEDRMRTWWWESLRGSPVATRYEEQSDGLALLSQQFAAKPNVFVLVTDQRSEPRGVLAGPIDSFVRLLCEVPYFEYAVVDADLDTLVFDTHHNEMIVAEGA